MRNISRPFFFSLLIIFIFTSPIFNEVYSVSLIWNPMGDKISKRNLSHSFSPISIKLYDHGSAG